MKSLRRSLLRRHHMAVALLFLQYNSFLVLPTAKAQIPDCELEIWVYGSEAQCNNLEPPSARARLYADDTCRTNDIFSTSSESLESLFPGTYSARCSSAETVEIYQSGCVSPDCAPSSTGGDICARDFSVPSGFYSIVTPPEYPVMPMGTRACGNLYGSGRELLVVFSIFGDCAACRASTPSEVATPAPVSLAPTKAPSPAPTSTPTSNPTDPLTPPPTFLRTTAQPTAAPTTLAPAKAPTVSPTSGPTLAPSGSPISTPTGSTISAPTDSPTSSPTNMDISSLEPTPSSGPDVIPPVGPTIALPPTSSPTTESPTTAPTTVESGAVLAPTSSSSNTGAVIGGAVGGGFAILVPLLLCAVWYGQKRERTKQEDTSSGEKMIPTPQTLTAASPGIGSAVNSEILVPSDREDDVSTLGTPLVGLGYLEEDEQTASVGYDYRGRDKSVAEESRSVTMTSLGASTIAAYESRGLSLFDDERSFDEQFNDDADGFNVHDKDEIEGFDCQVPEGKLGIVLDSPSPRSPPIVHALRPDSILSGHVMVGDRLIAVDGVDVANLNHVEVSAMISRKSKQTRKLTFVRRKDKKFSGGNSEC